MSASANYRLTTGIPNDPIPKSIGPSYHKGRLVYYMQFVGRGSYDYFQEAVDTIRKDFGRAIVRGGSREEPSVFGPQLTCAWFEVIAPGYPWPQTSDPEGEFQDVR